MWVFFIIIVVLFVAICIHNGVSIDFKSFFRRGFKKIDNDFGLYCYTGKQGKGKTYTCVNFLNNYMQSKKSCTLLTNVKSYNNFSNRVEYYANINELFERAIQLVNDKHQIIIFFDEIFTVLEKNTNISKEVRSFISQLRKRKIILITTAQEWGEINLTFRRYCRFQIDCNMFPIPLLKTAFIIYKVNDGDLIKWDNDLQDWVAPTIKTYFGKCKISVINSYDTFETISTNK